MKHIIEQLRDLYFIQLKHYLIQYKHGYKQFRQGELNKAGTKKYSCLQLDYHFTEHLQGEFTIGTFSKQFSKFMTFDVDFHDKQMAKWITYKIAATLDKLGIEHYYISFSGSKGYHIDIFFEDLIHLQYAEKFFNYVLDRAEVRQYFKDESKKKFTMEFQGKTIQLGDVEFRPTSKLGVKIPLGIHQKTGNYCGFCNVENELAVMDKEHSQEYLFSIKKISHQIILDIIGESSQPVEKKKKKEIIKTEDAISSHKPLPSYEQSEDYSIDRAINLLQNGLQVQGSRNNSIFLIGLYFKYMGLDENKCRDELYTWMEWQNPNTYTTPLDECYKDIDRTVHNMYEKNYNLTANKKDLTVTYEEIKWIMENCPEKNQKLITYAMLIHSKRHANLQGVFFMPFKDIQTATGLYNEAVQNQVNKLIELGVIEVIERNRKPKGEGLRKKLPNLYRVNYQYIGEVQNAHDETFTTKDKNNIDTCLRFYFTDGELKSLLPRRQYKSLIG